MTQNDVMCKRRIGNVFELIIELVYTFIELVAEETLCSIDLKVSESLEKKYTPFFTTVLSKI